MPHFLFAILSFAFLSTSALADETKPTIDLSTQDGRRVVEEEYQSIRPGAMDERFEQEEGVGGTNFNLSYDEDQPERDEYGVIREIESPANIDYSKPPVTNSNE